MESNGRSSRRSWLLVAALLLLPTVGSCEMKLTGETASGYFGNTPEADLARAAAMGRVDEVRRLVAKGAKVNAVGEKNTVQMTPLGWALAAQNPEGMRALLELGADPNQPIGAAERKFSPVWIAAAQEGIEPLRVLLEFKGDPNTRHDHIADYVPLMAASTSLGPYRFEKVKLLLDAGADVNVQDKIGHPFLVDAASLLQYDIVLLGLERGYSNNLPLLAFEIQDRGPSGRAPLPPEHEPKRKQVMDALKRMGIEPPAKPPPVIAPEGSLR